MASRISPMKTKARASELRDFKKRQANTYAWEVLPARKFRMTDSERYLLEKSRRSYLLKAHGPAAVEARADLIPMGRN